MTPHSPARSPQTRSSWSSSAIALFALGRRVIRRIVKAEGGDPWLAKALTVCLVLHLLAAPVQIWAVNHLYGGIADFTRYVYRGAAMASCFRHFDFSLPPGLAGSSTTAQSASWPGLSSPSSESTRAAAFLIISFLSFIGIMCFYRAFTLTFGGAGNRRYGYLIFFLPSLIFWTSDVSKEAIMIFLLGVLTYGCAQVLARKGGFRAWLVILACLSRAPCSSDRTRCCSSWAASPSPCSFGRRAHRPSSSRPAARRPSSLLASMVGVAMFVTLHFLPGLHGSVNLSSINKNNQGRAPDSGAVASATRRAPLYYPEGRLRRAVRSAAVQRPRRWGVVPGLAEHGARS